MSEPTSPIGAETTLAGARTEVANKLAADFTDLDRALADWARRHGAGPLVARAFALASWAVARGHSCLALSAIPPTLMNSSEQAGLPGALADSALVGEPGQIRPLIVDQGRLYLQRYHAYETRLAARLGVLMAIPAEHVDVRRLQPDAGLFAADTARPDATNWQAMAAFAALRHHFTVISGGPGTGKTYTIVRLLRMLVEVAITEAQPWPHIALAAPTGKAAARMVDSVRAGLEAMATDPRFDERVRDAIPQTARTLHRLLGLTGTSTWPRFHADNPLPADVVVIDEASMVDLPMMAKLTDAVRDDARLILLGDRYQLASVEAGSVLGEICVNAGINCFTQPQQQAAGALLRATGQPAGHRLADHVVTLQTSRRFHADSTIGRLAVAVNEGDHRAALRILATDHDDLRYRNDSDAVALGRLMDERSEDYAALIEATTPEAALAALARQCILTAVRGGPAGSNALNIGITERLARRYRLDPNATWYHGRPIMVTRNDYRIGLHNGDVGVALKNDDGPLRVWFAGDSAPRAFLPGALPEHDTIYAMTIHKSQGSEFETVTLVLPAYDVPVLTRELFYTGLTRAQKHLFIHAPPDRVRTTIRRQLIRHSGLSERLADI